MAARGASAAAASACGALACSWPAPRTIRNRSRRLTAFRAGTAGTGLDRRPQRSDRYALGSGRCRPLTQYAAELVALASGRHPGHRQHDRGAVQQTTRTVPIVFAIGRRPGRRRLCRKPGAAGRQRHRIHPVRIQHECEMAGAAQRNRAAHNARGRPPGSRQPCRNRPVLPRIQSAGAVSSAWS